MVHFLYIKHGNKDDAVISLKIANVTMRIAMLLLYRGVEIVRPDVKAKSLTGAQPAPFSFSQFTARPIQKSVKFGLSRPVRIQFLQKRKGKKGKKSRCFLSYN